MSKELDVSILCKYCFGILESFLCKKPEPIFPDNFKGKSYPLFVTWTTGKDKELRGCIGTFAVNPLEINVKQYALISALKDTRFPPISKEEIPNLNCEVSLLVDFEKASNPMDWVVGTHGIDIDFKDKHGESYSATFLPEVAEEQNWDQRTTLKHLVMKAGYYGDLDSALKKMEVTRYKSLKTTVTYSEYKK